MSALIDTPEGRTLFRLLLVLVFALGLGIGSVSTCLWMAAAREEPKCAERP